MKGKRREHDQLTGSSTDIAEAIVGTWALVSFTRLDGTGAETDGPYGERPQGRIIYTADGYVMTVITAGDRPVFPDGDFRAASPGDLAAAFDTMAAYSGRYEIVGNTVVHHVDLAWVPSWPGTQVVREAHLDDDGRLVLVTPPMTMAGETVVYRLVWEREPGGSPHGGPQKGQCDYGD